MYKILGICFAFPFLIQNMESNPQENVIALYAVELNYLRKQILDARKQQEWLIFDESYKSEKRIEALALANKRKELEIFCLEDECESRRAFIKQYTKNKPCIIL